MDVTQLRRCGLAAIAGAALAILGNAFLFVVNPAVPDDRLSYPLSPQAYVPMQLFFALTQALLAAGVVSLVYSDVVRRSRTARVLGRLAMVGMFLTVPGELCSSWSVEPPQTLARSTPRAASSAWVSCSLTSA